VDAVTTMSRSMPGSAASAPELGGFLRRHVLLPGLNWHQVTPEPTSDPRLAPVCESLDVIGDGSLMRLTTPGHTAGTTSLLVRRTGGPPLLLACDLAYGVEPLQNGGLSGVGNRRRLAESSHRALALTGQQPGPVVPPADDPTAARRLLDTSHLES
jgi:N-acyl homoserine lactone hydrolase